MFTDKKTEKIRMVKKTFLLFIVAFFLIPSEAFSGQNAEILINAFNFKNDNGTARFSLFNRSKGFPAKYKYAHVTASVPIINNSATVRFENVEYGEYGISVLHDENNNYKMDSNLIGMPKEGFGISNYKDKKSRPSYDKSKIIVDDDVVININMFYLD